MPQGGCIQLQLTNVHVEDATALPGVGAGDWVKVAVSDTGVGIPEEAITKVFEPFFTTKAAGGGTGLGLATSAIFVEQANGTFRVQSTVGVGTCFEVYLPAVKGRPQPSGASSAPTGEHGEGTVLVVEDEPALRGILARTLLDAGYTVLAAANGAEALALVRDKREHIDMLVTDVIMPSMGGRALVEALRELDPDLPVLFISGYPADLDDENLKASRTELLRKPFAPNELLSRIHALAKKKS
jgi:two-component system cell cycle sensor histidine kinase/response regulator CckA